MTKTFLPSLNLHPMFRIVIDYMITGTPDWEGALVVLSDVARIDGQDPAQLLAETGLRTTTEAAIDIRYAQKRSLGCERSG